MTTTTTVPFKDLIPADAINARGSKAKDGLDELARSIETKGLIQPLAVRPADNGRYEIIDGRRRYQAMQRLVRERKWKKDAPVPVLVRNEDDAEALETSLIANTARLPMHPVDQHEVFARLSDQGLAVADIAARFAIAEKTVRQHLALGRLAPEIREAWRKGKIDAKVAQAFTLSDSHELQVAAYDRLRKSGGGVQDWSVRRELTGDRPRVDSLGTPLLEAYLAAGGTVSESLFEEQRYIDDGALLNKVRAEIAEDERRRLLADGWSWVALDDELPHEWRWDWERALEGIEPVYHPGEEQRLAALDVLLGGVDADDPEFAKAKAETEAIEQRARERAFTPEIRIRSGAVIKVHRYGELSVALGVVRPGDVWPGTNVDLRGPPDGAEPRDRSGDGKFGNWHEDDVYDPTEDYRRHDRDEELEPAEPEAPKDDGPRISNALLESLTTTLTLAAQSAIADDPLVALRAAVAALTAPNWGTPVKLEARGLGREAHNSRAQGDFGSVFRRLKDEPASELMGRFAVLLATALDMRSWNTSSDLSNTEALRDALPADAYLAAARELFNATDYFNRVPKAIAEAALAEMGRPVGSGAKKADLVDMAAARAKEAGWLPPELRHPEYRLITEKETAA